MDTKTLKEKLQKEGKKGLALDIDETLGITVLPWIHQMHKLFGAPDGMTPEAVYKKYRYTMHIPFWQHEEAQSWVQGVVGADKEYQNAPLIEEAPETVKKIGEIIPIVAYISARPANLLETTKTWLKKHGFPEADILLRPVDIPFLTMSTWKADVLMNLYPNVVGIVDDNAALAIKMPAGYKGTLFLYEVESLDRKDIDIHCCSHWEDVYKCVKEKYSKV